MNKLFKYYPIFKYLFLTILIIFLNRNNYKHNNNSILETVYSFHGICFNIQCASSDMVQAEGGDGKGHI